MALQTISLTKDKHFELYLDGSGWSWSGLGVFDRYCSDTVFELEDDAYNNAIDSLLALLL